MASQWDGIAKRQTRGDPGTQSLRSPREIAGLPNEALMRLLFFLLAFLALVPTSGTIAAEPALFGTREVFSSDSSAFFKWHGVMQRFAAEERRVAGCRHRDSEMCRSAAAWQALVRSLAGLSLRESRGRQRRAQPAPLCPVLDQLAREQLLGDAASIPGAWRAMPGLCRGQVPAAARGG